MKFPNGIDYLPKFHSVHEGSTSSYNPCSYYRHEPWSEHYEKKFFFGYDLKPKGKPHKCIITNLTSPNREEILEPLVKGKHMIVAHHGDILTIETERERHVVCVSGDSVYSLLSSTAEMSWPHEVKEALDAISSEKKNNREIVKSYISERFLKNFNDFPERDIDTITEKIYAEMSKHNKLFSEEEIAKSAQEIYPVLWNIAFAI